MGSWYRKTPPRWTYTTPIKAPLQASATLRFRWACKRRRRLLPGGARGVNEAPNEAPSKASSEAPSEGWANGGSVGGQLAGGAPGTGIQREVGNQDHHCARPEASRRGHLARQFLQRKSGRL